jgi:soluble lytic murein transglycosylase-like protein
MASTGATENDLILNTGRYNPLVPIFEQVEREKKVPAHLLAAVAWSESAFDPNVVNSIGATGLMQLIPSNFQRYGIAGNPKDPLGNVRAGAMDLLAKGYGKKDLRSVLKGYNGFRSEDNPEKLAAFQRYYQRITARWMFLAGRSWLP